MPERLHSGLPKRAYCIAEVGGCNIQFPDHSGIGRYRFTPPEVLMKAVLIGSDGTLVSTTVEESITFASYV